MFFINVKGELFIDSVKTFFWTNYALLGMIIRSTILIPINLPKNCHMSLYSILSMKLHIKALQRVFSLGKHFFVLNLLLNIKLFLNLKK